MPRERGFWFLGPQWTVDPVWTAVLTLEQQGQQDWRPQAAWLEAVVSQAAGPAVVAYQLGLGAWQRRDDAAARRWFGTCLEGNPPVLNPAVYYLCLHRTDEHEARTAEERLRDHYSAAEWDQCRKALPGGK
jgi:hypothetical protein